MICTKPVMAQPPRSRVCTSERGRRRLASPFGVGLRGLALELQRLERLVAQYPRVMPRLDAVDVTGAEVDFVSIVGRDVNRAGAHVAQVRGLPALAPDPRLAALRPPPSRLGPQARDRGRSELDN